jgi:hypothetical protein
MMIAKVMKEVVPGQEASENERDNSAKMVGGALEASTHAVTIQEGGPENRQQLRQQPKPKLQLKLRVKLQPKQHHKCTPKSAPTPSSRLETVPPEPSVRGHPSA